MYKVTLSELFSIIPELFLTLMALIMLALGVIKKNGLNTIHFMALFALLIGFCLILIFPTHSIVSFNNFFIANPFTQFCKAAITFTVFLIIFMNLKHFERDQIHQYEFSILVLFSTIGMMLTISANDLISLFMALEFQSLTLYILIALPRNETLATEASLKYFILGSLSTAFILFGSSLMYGLVGTTEFKSLMIAFKEIQIHEPMLIISLVMLLTGLALKLSLVPFHMWAPDVYEGSTISVTSLIASAPKVAIFSLLMRFFVQILDIHQDIWQSLLVIIAILSMGLGSFAAIFQKNIKRLLAYSTISHMGYIVLGLLGRNQQGAESVLCYLIIYVLTIIGIFACLLNIRRQGKIIENIDELNDLSHEQPIIAGMLSIFMLSMAGIPPLAGFFVKVKVFIVAINAGYISLVVVGVVTTIIAAFYYIRIIKIMYFKSSSGFPLMPKLEHYTLQQTRVVMYLTVCIVLLYGIYPAPLIIFVKDAAKALFHNA